MTALKFALAAPGLQLDVIDGLEFVDLVRHWDVNGVPTIIVGDSSRLEGAVEEKGLAEALLQIHDPSIRTAQTVVVPFRGCARVDSWSGL